MKIKNFINILLNYFNKIKIKIKIKNKMINLIINLIIEIFLINY